MSDAKKPIEESLTIFHLALEALTKGKGYGTQTSHKAHKHFPISESTYDKRNLILENKGYLPKTPKEHDQFLKAYLEKKLESSGPDSLKPQPDMIVLGEYRYDKQKAVCQFLVNKYPCVCSLNTEDSKHAMTIFYKKESGIARIRGTAHSTNHDNNQTNETNYFSPEILYRNAFESLFEIYLPEPKDGDRGINKETFKNKLDAILQELSIATATNKKGKEVELLNKGFYEIIWKNRKKSCKF